MILNLLKLVDRSLLRNKKLYLRLYRLYLQIKILLAFIRNLGTVAVEESRGKPICYQIAMHSNTGIHFYEVAEHYTRLNKKIREFLYRGTPISL